MSARDELRKYVNLLADWWTPRATTDGRVERLYGQVRDEVLREAAEKIRQRAQDSWDEMKPLAYAEGREDGLQAAADLIDPDKED